MTEPTSEPRANQLCDVCWQVDDAPRHVVNLAPDFPGGVPSDDDISALDDRTDVTASMVRAVLDPTTVIRHHDCCAARGCPTGVCGPLTAVAAGAQNEELLELIQSGAVAHLTTPNFVTEG